MRKYVDGEYLDMTEEEIQEMKDRMPPIPERVKTEIEKRVEILEKIIEKIKSLFRID
jgi:hypothetical protein